MASELFFLSLRALGNLPILTEGASEIASNGRDGKRCCTWQKMIKGFFFDGIDMGGDDFSIDMSIQLPFPVLSHSTNTEFPIDYRTAMIAKEA